MVDEYYRVDNGAGGELRLFVTCQGSGPPLLLLHGFTGSAGTLAETARALQAHYTVLRVDLIGHGRSDAPDDVTLYSMANCLRQLVSLLDQLAIPSCHWLGYSMGARVVLSLCAAYPERVCSAMLVGVSPGFDCTRQRQQRLDADRELARTLLRSGIEPFVDQWLAQPLFKSQRELGAGHRRAMRAQRLANRPGALAASLQGMGSAAMPPLHSALASIRCPVCLVVGELDHKFRSIARELHRQLPNASLAVLAGAGHAAHAENPGALRAVALEFLGGVAGAGTFAPNGTPNGRPDGTPIGQPG